MSDVTITLPDGSSRAVPAGTPVADVAAAISPRLAKAALAAAVDDRLVDLSFRLDSDATVRIDHARPAPKRLTLYRHSTAHLLAAAVTQSLPRRPVRHRARHRRRLLLRLRRATPVRPRGSRGHRAEDARAGAAGSARTSGRCGRARRRRAFFGARGEPLKVQLIDEKTEGQVRSLVLHDQGSRHLRRFLRRAARAVDGRLKAFKLLSTSNAYWKGDARNQPMQRIYGTAFFSDKELQEYLHRLEEAKKRDHRKIGREQKLFMFHPWAPGATFWLAKGTITLQHARRLHAERALSRRLRRGEDADRLQQGALGNVRPLAALPPEHVSGREPKASRWG